MSEQGEEQWAEDAALRGASVEDDGGGYGLVNPYRLGSICQEVQNPVAEWRGQSESWQFIHQCLRYDGVEGRGEI